MFINLYFNSLFYLYLLKFNYLNKNKKLIKNYSSIDIHKNKSKLPPIYEKRNFENKYKRIFPRNKSDFGIKLTKNIQ